MHSLICQQIHHPVGSTGTRKISAKEKLSSTIFKIVGMTMLITTAMGMAVNSAYATDNLAHQDKSFLTNAAQAGNTEIEASRLALTKTSNTQIKKFAQQMIDDHSEAGGNLKKLAVTKNFALPEGPGLIEKAKIAGLGALQGHYFDKEYMSMIGVSAHKDAVELFKKTSVQAVDPDIKQFAANNLPELQHHLELAQKLKTTVDAVK